jgi:DNA-binding protein H-NS
MEFKKPKQKKCKVCGTLFTPFKTTAQVCSISCAITHGNATQAKKMRQEIRQAKEALKTRQDWIREAQRWFNRYIRLRDKDEPCISCGRHHKGQYHAGHFRTTAAAPQLRFNEEQVWKQCDPCNSYLSGNLLEYRKNLIKRIGVERVEALENDNTIKRWTIEELQEIKKIYKQKCKELENGN